MKNSNIIGFIQSTYDQFLQSPQEMETQIVSKVDGIWTLTQKMLPLKTAEDELINDFAENVEFESDWFDGGDSKRWIETAKKMEFIFSKTKDEDFRFKLLVRLIEENRTLIAMDIEDFSFEDEGKRFQLACKAIEKEPTAVMWIDRFNISEKHRLQIVMQMAETHPDIIVFHINKCSITDQDDLFAFLKKIAEKSPETLAMVINHCGVESQERRFELALMVEPFIKLNIEKFSLKEEQRFQLALKGIKNIAETIRNYKLGQDNRFKIALKVIDENIEEINSVMFNFNLNESYSFQFILKVAEKKPHYFEKYNPYFCSVIGFEKNSEVARKICGDHQKFLADLEITDEKEVIFCIQFLARALREGASFEALEAHKSLIKDLIHLKNETFRDNLVKCLFAEKLLAKNPDIYLSKISIRSTDLQKFVRVLLASLLLNPSPFLERLYSKEMKDNRKERSLIQFLITLYNTEELSKEQKEHLLQKVASTSDFPKAMQMIKLIEGIILLKGCHRLAGTEDLSQLFETLFKEFLGVQKIDNFTEKYQRIESFRKKELLFTYSAQQNGNRVVLESFKEFIISVLNGDFKEKRYSIKTSEHLTKVFSKEDLKREWIKGDVQQAVVFKEAFMAFKEIPLSTKVKDALLQNHLPDLETKYPQVFRFLNNEKEIVIDENSFEYRVIQLIKGDAKEEVLGRWLQDLPDCQFKSDATEWLNPQKIDIKNLNSLTVEDSDDPQDIFLCGESFGNSCQRITHGISELNQGLVGYLHNGYNRVILVKDNEGVIVGRALLRLYWDKENKTAVLYQDRYYGNLQLESLVTAMCKKRAQAMNLVLTSAQGNKLYAGIVEAEPKVGEYVDALRGVRISPYILDKNKVFVSS